MSKSSTSANKLSNWAKTRWRQVWGNSLSQAKFLFCNKS